MWISFKASDPFAIKIYLGGVNAVSGEPARETETTMMRRLRLLKTKKSVQDYVVAPAQLWLDGIAGSDGTERQFVAMPLGSGYSVEAQITGDDAVDGLQIEVTPSKLYRKLYTQRWEGVPEADRITIVVKTVTDDEYDLRIHDQCTLSHVQDYIRERTGIPQDQQRLIFAGKQMEDCRTLAEYGVKNGNTINLCLRLRGGGGDPN